jgi:glucose-6-phosphate dehydrogenase assembly protein OpcA
MSNSAPIDVEKIEQDIKAVWSKASQTVAIDSAVSRACFSNLIVYTEDVGDEEKITETISEFVGKHPCRTILIIAQPRNNESKLEVSVSTHVKNPHGARKNVACEQITLRASGGSVKELASAVQPLLVPDLPIFLWWRGVFLSQKALLEQMLAFADRFIYDGVSWTDLHYTVPQVSDCIERYKDNVGFSNFNWSRLRPWREYAADFFDPGMFEIRDLNYVRVDFMALPGYEEGYQFRALLFISWMAAQLEWEPVQGKPGVDLALIQFKNPRGDLINTELAMLPQTSELSQSIQKITMGVRRPDDPQEFTIHRDHKDHLMVLSCNRQGTTSIVRKVPHIDSSPAELLYRELGKRTRNHVFEKSFRIAARLIQMI